MKNSNREATDTNPSFSMTTKEFLLSPPVVGKDSFRPLTIDERYILKNLDPPTLYDQLAEECNELAQAALKASRAFRGSNPTPKSYDEIVDDLIDESLDVFLCVHILGLPYGKVPEGKLARWVRRLEEREQCE